MTLNLRSRLTWLDSKWFLKTLIVIAVLTAWAGLGGMIFLTKQNHELFATIEAMRQLASAKDLLESGVELSQATSAGSGPAYTSTLQITENDITVTTSWEEGWWWGTRKIAITDSQ